MGAVTPNGWGDAGTAGQLRSLLGDSYRRVGVLIATSVLAGIGEAAILATIAQVAAALVSGATRVHGQLGPVKLDVTVGTLLAISLALA